MSILDSAKFDQIKEMLFCMDGISCSDNELVQLIVTNGGIDRYFEELMNRYIDFIKIKNRHINEC